jgi:hypothetical protein
MTTLNLPAKIAAEFRASNNSLVANKTAFNLTLWAQSCTPEEFENAIKNPELLSALGVRTFKNAKGVEKVLLSGHFSRRTETGRENLDTIAFVELRDLSDLNFEFKAVTVNGKPKMVAEIAAFGRGVYLAAGTGNKPVMNFSRSKNGKIKVWARKAYEARANQTEDDDADIPL